MLITLMVALAGALLRASGAGDERFGFVADDGVADVETQHRVPGRIEFQHYAHIERPAGRRSEERVERGPEIVLGDVEGREEAQHPPARDGCTTCHDPHGSGNERMLVSRTPIICQRCHVHTRHPSTIYDAGAIGTLWVRPAGRRWSLTFATGWILLGVIEPVALGYAFGWPVVVSALYPFLLLAVFSSPSWRAAFAAPGRTR